MRAGPVANTSVADADECTTELLKDFGIDS